MNKILIVDDSQFMRNMLKDIILKKGEFQIIETDSGSNVEELCKKNKPDLTLLDIIMPEGEEEGVRVLKRIMAADPENRVVMVTAVGRETLIEECKNIGAKDYITKPFDENQILDTLEKYLV